MSLIGLTGAKPEIFVLPDAGPLITLAYADALDLLFKPGWSVAVVDMVQHEVTRHETPTSSKIGRWIQSNGLPIIETQIYAGYRKRCAELGSSARSANLGELAIQEAMHRFATDMSLKQGVFLFEDHKIARSSFVLPENCLKVSTRSLLLLLERKGWIPSAVEIERQAVLAGRSFSRLRFPPA
jgi:hypothetical protein